MNMFGYVNNLRSMSQGRATFTMQFTIIKKIKNEIVRY